MCPTKTNHKIYKHILIFYQHMFIIYIKHSNPIGIVLLTLAK